MKSSTEEESQKNSEDKLKSNNKSMSNHNTDNEFKIVGISKEIAEAIENNKNKTNCLKEALGTITGAANTGLKIASKSFGMITEFLAPLKILLKIYSRTNRQEMYLFQTIYLYQNHLD